MRPQGYGMASSSCQTRTKWHLSWQRRSAVRKQGYADRLQVPYQEHRYQGLPVFASIEGHSGVILMDKILA